MTVKVAINGFGRIGRMVFRQMMKENEFHVAAVNASYPAETIAHMIKYDSVHGRYTGEVEVISEEVLHVDGKEIHIVRNRDPEQLPWKLLGIDLVIEATGKFKTNESAGKHLSAGASKVIVTAPAKGEMCTIVMGVNDSVYNPEEDHVVSNASCTTNCLAPVVKILDDTFGIKTGMMTTVHAITNDQRNIDNPHKDLRRARACGQSIIPTSTGAAKAIGEVLPHLKGRLDGLALRVPTPDVSLVDLVVDLNENVTVEKVNEVFKNASKSEYRGLVDYSEDPLVSIDFTTDPHSAIIDGQSTNVLGDNKVKVLAWYDNEWGYSARIIDLAKMMAKSMTAGKTSRVS